MILSQREVGEVTDFSPQRDDEVLDRARDRGLDDKNGARPKAPFVFLSYAPRGPTSRGLRLTMEWVVPVMMETHNIRQSMIADAQSIAQAQAAAQALQEQLFALAHSAEMGIHQLQQELHLASAIKLMLEESNPSLRLHWPEFSNKEDLLLAGPPREASTHPDHASVVRGGREVPATAGLIYSCSQGVIVEPASQLATCTRSAWPSSASAPPSKAASTPCWKNVSARAGLGTARNDTLKPEAGQVAASTAARGLTTQPGVAAVPGESAAAVAAVAQHLPPKVARDAPAARKVPAMAHPLGNEPSREAPADRPVVTTPAAADETSLAPAAAAPAPAAAAVAPALALAGQTSRGQELKLMR